VIPVRKSEFAKLAGVSGAAVTKASATTLKAALVGRQIDRNHPDAIAYVKKHKQPDVIAVKKAVSKKVDGRSNPKHKAAARKSKRKKEEKDEGVIPGSLESLPEKIQALADQSLRELAYVFGTDIAFLDWLKATREIERVHEARLKNQEKEGTLVHRELVKSGILDPIETLYSQILRDGAKTIAVKVMNLMEAGEPVEICEKAIRKELTSFIRPAKAKMERAIKGMKK